MPPESTRSSSRSSISVYLTEQVGAGLPGPTTPASWLGRVLTIAGLCVAVLAPATGVLVNAPHRRRVALAVLTGVVVALTSAMSLIRADYHYLWPGLVLLAGTAAFSDLATVPYNAMLRQLSTPANVRSGIRIWFGSRVFRQRRAAADRVPGFHRG